MPASPDSVPLPTAPRIQPEPEGGTWPLRLVAELLDFETTDGVRLTTYLDQLRQLEGFSDAYAQLLQFQQRWCHPDRSFLAEEVRTVEEEVRQVLADPVAVLQDSPQHSCCQLRSWTLVMRLCEACIDIAARDPEQGRAVARAAGLLARHLEGWVYHDTERRQLEALTWAHVANTYRIPGDLRRAQSCFHEVHARRPAPGDEIGGLWAQIHWIEASLLRDQRKLTSARQRLEEAITLAAESGCHQVQVGALMNLAFVDFLEGNLEEALENSRQALRQLDPAEHPRWYADACINVAHYLSRLGDAEAALAQLAHYLPALRRYGSTADLLRATWVEATALYPLGNTEEAIARYEEARQGFMKLQHIDSMAIVTLELAIVHLEQGRTAEVKRLATEILPVFEMQGIDREARATLELFRQAVVAEQVTLLQLQGWLRRLGA